MSLQDLQNYYAGLLIIQYRTLPKATMTIQCLSNQSLCDGLLQQEQTCFNLNTATGAQLTILGKIVGVPRNIYGLDLEHQFFNFIRYVGTPSGNGFGRYTDNPYSNVLFYRYSDTATYTLTDFEMLTLIQLKIIFNNTYSSMRNLKNALYATFQGGIDIVDDIYSDDAGVYYFAFRRYTSITLPGVGFGRYTQVPYTGNGDFFRYTQYNLMSLVYNVKTVYANAFAAAQFLNIVPKPMGVALTVNYI